VAVTVQTSNAAVAAVASPLVIPGGAPGATLNVDLKAVGTANISISQPAGFTPPASGSSTAVTVNP
jgi:S1-C subfamily serine protease